VLHGLMVGRLRIPVVMSLTALILVNLVPLAGVLWFGWRMFDVLMLFWMESVVIGVINLLRMAVRLFGAGELKGVVLIPFFTVHYFGFCAAHGLILVLVFGPPGLSPAQVLGASGFLEIIRQLLSEPTLRWGLIAIAASHLFSFLANFLWAGEWRRTGIDVLMGAPYGRIMLMHVVLVIGAAIFMSIGQPIYALALLVALKILADTSAHLRERRKLGGANQDD
jgi:hypothetical protein